MRKKPEASSGIDRLPPNSGEAERAVLGCILLSPTETMGECVIRIKSAEGAFYDLRNALIYGACLTLFEGRKPIDLVTLQSHLKPSGELERVGGVTYLMELMDSAPPVPAVTEYIGILLRNFLLRKMIALCTETVGKAFEANGDSMDLVDQFETKALGLRSTVESAQGLVNIRQVQTELMADYDSAWSKQRAMGIHTGFDDLDKKCGGMMEQEMIVLAGLRSSGKTSLAVTIAYNVAKAGTGVGLFTLETSGKKIIHRLGCSLGRYDGSLLLRGVTTERDSPRVIGAFKSIASCRDKLLVSDAGPLSPNQLAAIARRMYQAGARLFIVDYLQLLSSPGLKEYERTTYASRAIKNLAKELNCPVIILSSLSRDSDKDKRSPRLSDLRASGQIEYDADKVWLLHPKDNEDIRTVVLDVAKNKDGPTGTIELVFVAKEFRMESVASVSDETAQMMLSKQPHKNE